MNEVQELYYYWIKERESVRIKKESGLPKPWSDDPIFQTYKFCNVRREDDTVSKWIRTNWMDKYIGHQNMWFAMIVARLFNWPDTLEVIGFPKDNITWPERREIYRKRPKGRRDIEKKKIFTGAYLV